MLDFADVVANDHADNLIMATNTSSNLHVKFKVWLLEIEEDGAESMPISDCLSI